MLDRSLLPPSGPLVVAVSGGCDSMALWALLAAVGSWQLTIYHLDHAIRADSPVDGEVIRSADLPGTRIIERADIPALAAAWKVGLEAAGRRQRYTRLAEVARQVCAPLVVTAHHRDDQVETVLLNLLRGSHGLVGMPASRPLAPATAEAAGIALVRPLLAVSRADVRAWATAQRIPWREDSTNTDTAYRRNHLRHVLLPALEAARPGLTSQLLAGLRPAGGPHEDPIRTLARDLGLPISRPALTRLRDLPEGARTTLGGWLFTRTAGELTWEPEHPPPAPPAQLIPGPGTYIREGVSVREDTRGSHTLTIRAATPAEQADPRSVIILADPQWPLIWRTPLPGERWRPLGAPGRQLLMDSLAARKVPARRRPLATVLADRDGPVWLPLLTIAERTKVTPATTAAWVITLTT